MQAKTQVDGIDVHKRAKVQAPVVRLLKMCLSVSSLSLTEPEF